MNPLCTESRRPDPNGRGYLPAALFEGLTVIAARARPASRGHGQAGPAALE
jgi:hypothetical protein